MDGERSLEDAIAYAKIEVDRRRDLLFEASDLLVYGDMVASGELNLGGWSLDDETRAWEEAVTEKVPRLLKQAIDCQAWLESYLPR